jgi:hypothetical protein
MDRIGVVIALFLKEVQSSLQFCSIKANCAYYYLFGWPENSGRLHLI